MNKTAVLLADSARARIFEVVRQRGQAGASEPALVEIRDLVQAGRRGRPAELLSESRPGSRWSDAPAGPGHALDDHRDAKITEGDRRFAGEIVRALDELCATLEIDELLVVAPPRFAGHLRERGVESSCDMIRMVTLDLSTMAAPAALERLRAAGHISPA